MINLGSLLAVALLAPSPVNDSVVHGAACSVQNKPASIVQQVNAEYPDIARLARITGTTIVRVDLAPTGALVSAEVNHSSGSKILDMAALRAVRQMTYAAEVQSCDAVAGSYAVNVHFE